MKFDLIVQSQNGITCPRMRKPSRDIYALHPITTITPHYNNYIQNLFGLMKQFFYVKTTLKSLR